MRASGAIYLRSLLGRGGVPGSVRRPYVSRRAKILLAVIIVVALVAVAGFFVVRSRGAGPVITTGTVEQQELSVSVQASGKVETGIKADLFPPTVGTLDEVFVDDGQKVKTGQEIAVMDKAPLEVQVAQAEAGVAQAEAQLHTVTQQAPSSADIAAAQAGVKASKAAYDAAKAAQAEVGTKAPSEDQLAAAHAATVAAKQAYDLANAAYKAAKAAVDASSSPTPGAIATVAQLQTTKDQAYAAYLSAKATEESLKATSLTAAEKQSKAAVDQAFAAYKSSQAQLAKLEGTSTSAAEAAARASVDQAQQALAAAQANLAAATFTAPFDGVVLFNPLGTPGATGDVLTASAGAAVAPQVAPFTVVDLGGVKFSAQVDEADVERVKPGMDGQVSLDAFPGQSFDSKVLEVRSAAQQTATGGTIFPVDMSLETTESNVLIGMQGDAKISVSSVPDAIVIPIESLFDQNGQSYVFVVENGHLKKTNITTGAMTETTVQVVSGLAPGQVVALSGSVEYTDGMAVRTQ